MSENTNDAPRDVRLLDIPGYFEWSNKRLQAGESEAFIAHLHATSMWLRTSELNGVTHDEFEDMLADLKTALGRAGQP